MSTVLQDAGPARHFHGPCGRIVARTLQRADSAYPHSNGAGGNDDERKVQRQKTHARLPKLDNRVPGGGPGSATGRGCLTPRGLPQIAGETCHFFLKHCRQDEAMASWKKGAAQMIRNRISGRDSVMPVLFLKNRPRVKIIHSAADAYQSVRALASHANL